MGIKKVYKTLYFVRKANCAYVFYLRWMTHFKCDISGSPFGIHIHGRKRSFECLYKNVDIQKYICTYNKFWDKKKTTEKTNFN